MTGLEGYADSFGALAVAVPRIAVAFLVLPLLTPEAAPPLVRNVFVFSLTLSLYPLIGSTLDVAELGPAALVPLVLKECFLGLVIAWLFSIVFWALEGAGEIIDAKIGSTTAQIVDPVLGHQTTLTATFLARLAAYVFVAFGGLAVFLGVLLKSYVVWPIDAMLPALEFSADLLFVRRFSDLMAMMLTLAAPVIVVLSLVEFGFGLVNRFAERLNVFSISMAAKAWIALAIVALVVATMIDYVILHIADQASLLEVLKMAVPQFAPGQPG